VRAQRQTSYARVPGHSPSSVQTEAPDHAYRRRGDEKFHRTTVSEPGSQLARGEIDRRHRDTLHSPAAPFRAVWNRSLRHTPSLHDHQGGRITHLVHPLPRAEVSDEIGAHDQKEISPGSFFEVRHRVGGVTRATSLDLYPARFHPGDALHRCSNDAEAVLCFCHVADTYLLPWLVRHNEEYAVEGKRVPHAHCRYEMSHVNGIEGSSEDPGPSTGGHLALTAALDVGDSNTSGA
jgi:hypothetical protein